MVRSHILATARFLVKVTDVKINSSYYWLEISKNIMQNKNFDLNPHSRLDLQ